ncbi:MAG: KH domain-containing protein [Desulfobacter sp.]|nr:KH domain-containing protein [Desulfobacter sp.]
MKELIETMAMTLVDEPDSVSVTEVGGMHTSILALKVYKPDMGKVIGKQGRTADALRTILSAVSAKLNKRVFLEIVDD